MSLLRRTAAAYLALLFAVSLFSSWLAPYSYASQFRSHINEAPSAQFLLGTDDLGRDRLSRLLFALRVSLLIAPAAGAVTIGLAAVLGFLSGWRRGWFDAGVMLISDLMLSLPLLFLVLTLRALLPLNASPVASATALAMLLAAVGWPAGTRVVRAVSRELLHGPPVLYASAYGSSPIRLFLVHAIPHLARPIAAQFWILVPAFVTAEANLGILGLGVSEPMPSLGNMLSELLSYERIGEAPWILVPAAILVSILTALHILVSRGD